MPPRRNKKFRLLTGFERNKNKRGLREGEFSYHAIGTGVQRKHSKVMRVWKKWTDERRTTRKTGNG
ncbi:UNVERIFIED_CONTAM: hypothetical protein NCL1_11912 [Trichonephila clavipes]